MQANPIQQRWVVSSALPSNEITQLIGDGRHRAILLALSSTRMRRSSKRFWRSRLFGQAGVSRSYTRAAGSRVHSYPAERAVPDQDASFRASRLGVADPSVATAVNPVELRSHATPARPTRRKPTGRTNLVVRRP